MTDTPIRLLGQEQSINTHKAVLMLTMTDTPFEFEVVDLLSGGHKTPEYETLNPWGRVPTMIDGEHVLFQTVPMLKYLARKTGQFGTEDEFEGYGIGNWFGFSTDYFSAGLARLRFINRFMGGEPVAIKDHYRPNMLRGLDLLNRHLESNDWLVGGRPTIAEFAVHPFVYVWPDAEVDIADWPAIGPWLERFQALPGWTEPEALLRGLTGNR
ncbi:MAG: glutathione S-transferase family protein [Alphaproteobacteria bacterium]|nr:glutathione S-transferase family protein [Alphaproteobacteria bacterium]